MDEPMKKRYYMDLTAVGRRLRAVRTALDLSIERMQDISGYSRSLISAAENGLKKPSTVYLYTLFDKFNVNIHHVFSGKGPMFLDKSEPGETNAAEPPPKPQKTEEQQEKTPRDPRIDFIESDEKIKEMIFLMEKFDLVRYSMITEFVRFQVQNREMIDTLKKKLANENQEQNR